MLTIGITGITGLLGWHLHSYLFGFKDINVIGADKETFEDSARLVNFVSRCEIIIHFAGMNRGEDSEIMNTNIDLTDKLIIALKKSKNKPHLIFSSSTQVYKKTVYGNSKIECSDRLSKWADENNALFSNLILPNVFGEKGKPFHNSVVSTFCYQIANKKDPRIIVDNEVEFLHAGELARQIYEIIAHRKSGDISFPGVLIKVSALLTKIRGLALLYENKTIPDLKDKFDLQLFNTYRSYLYPYYYPVAVQLNKDGRGELIETAKSLGEGQCFISKTRPGITRGNHYHLNKFERFLVLKGKAVVRIRCLFSGEINTFEVNGDIPSYIDIPTMHTHNITNTGDNELITFFWVNKIFDPNLPDTFMESVEVKNEQN